MPLSWWDSDGKRHDTPYFTNRQLEQLAEASMTDTKTPAPDDAALAEQVKAVKEMADFARVYCAERMPPHRHTSWAELASTLDGAAASLRDAAAWASEARDSRAVLRYHKDKWENLEEVVENQGRFVVELLNLLRAAREEGA